ncbi:MAG: hypothetical protein ACFFG0_02630 [Candidatus Thorarchaeota archaeon]
MNEAIKMMVLKNFVCDRCNLVIQGEIVYFYEYFDGETGKRKIKIFDQYKHDFGCVDNADSFDVGEFLIEVE